MYPTVEQCLFSFIFILVRFFFFFQFENENSYFFILKNRIKRTRFQNFGYSKIVLVLFSVWLTWLPFNYIFKFLATNNRITVIYPYISATIITGIFILRTCDYILRNYYNLLITPFGFTKTPIKWRCLSSIKKTNIVLPFPLSSTCF